MPRPTIKMELETTALIQWNKMWEMINVMSEMKRETEFNFSDVPNLKEAHWMRDRNIRDILIHLYEWHELLLNWINANIKGTEVVAFLPEPYNWKTYGEMNVEFFKKHQSTSFNEAVALLENSHEKVMKLIDNFSDEELFQKKHYKWTGTSSLGSYFISVTSSHYDWSIKKLKLHNKTYKG